MVSFLVFWLIDLRLGCLCRVFWGTCVRFGCLVCVLLLVFSLLVVLIFG